MEEQIVQPEEKQIQEPKKWHMVLKIIVIIVLIISCFLLYARFIGTSGLKIKEYKVTNKLLPRQFHGMKIVHISDVHYGRIIHKKELQNIVTKINELKPDIVVLTGDLIDKDTKLTKKDQEIITETFKNIEAKMGKYAVTGNHDVSFKAWDTIIEDSDFMNLNDTYDIIYSDNYEPIMIAGISSNLKNVRKVKDKIINITEYFNRQNSTIKTDSSDSSVVQETKYHILLLHEPDYIDQMDHSSFQLILSGHSHNGQVRFPIIGALYTPVGSKKYYKPHYTVGNSELYISSGIGTSTINFRWFNRPSINFYRLTVK